MTDVHCPECGAITRRERDDRDGWEYAVCTNDDCPRIIVATDVKPHDEGPTGVAAFYSARMA